MLGRKRKSGGRAGRRRERPEAADSNSYNNRARQANSSQNLDRHRPPGQGFSSFLAYWSRRFGVLVLLVAAVASVVSVLGLSTEALVQPQSSSSGDIFLQPMGVYRAKADQLLNSSLWNRNKLTINSGAINRQMLQAFPELASVNITLPLISHRPLVYIQPAQPALLLITNQGSFVIDNRGKALFTSHSASVFTRLNLPPVIDQSGLNVQLNRQVLSSQSVSFIRIVAAELAGRRYPVASMVLPQSTAELDVHLVGQPFFVKFNLQNNDARQQAGTYAAAIEQLKRQNITPGQYVDVRVDGRAYYK